MPGWRAFATTRWKVIVYQRNHPTVVEDPYAISMEMYDLASDPHELQSLAADEALPSGLKRALRYLKRLTTCSGTEGETSCSIPGSARR